MGFLDKHNPNATRQSARIWAIGGGIVGALIGFGGVLFCWLRSEILFGAVFYFVPSMAVACAVAGWAIEWQLPPEAECSEAAEPGAAADRGNGDGLPGREVSAVAAAAELGCSALGGFNG